MWWVIAIALSTGAPTFDGLPGQHGPGARLVDGAARQGPMLQVPWACGATESCTQGHNTGSHTGQSAYAWDFVLQDGEEIWAVSAGVVTHVRNDAPIGGCDIAYIEDANYVTVDHGDGTSLAYAHMRSGTIPWQVGEEVEVGDLIGRVGQTGYVCGAHLHMAVIETCGASYCQSVPGTFADYGVPDGGEQFEGTNCPTCTKALAGGETIVDDEDAGCLLRETTSWTSSFSGHGDHHFYTLATDAAEDVSSASWIFDVTTPGDYRVEVFVPDADADTNNALYQVVHADGTTEVAIDQSMAKGWQELGTFAFAGGGDERITLGDATGEDLDTLMVRIGYDAVRFTFVPATGSTDGGSDGTADTTDGADDGTTGSSATGAVDDGDSTGTVPGDGSGDENALPPGWGEPDGESGCGCDAGARDRDALALFAVVLLARRRRGNRTTRRG